MSKSRYKKSRYSGTRKMFKATDPAEVANVDELIDEVPDDAVNAFLTEEIEEGGAGLGFLNPEDLEPIAPIKDPAFVSLRPLVPPSQRPQQPPQPPAAPKEIPADEADHRLKGFTQNDTREAMDTLVQTIRGEKKGSPKPEESSEVMGGALATPGAAKKVKVGVGPKTVTPKLPEPPQAAPEPAEPAVTPVPPKILQDGNIMSPDLTKAGMQTPKAAGDLPTETIEQEVDQFFDDGFEITEAPQR
jgi:hypothetical protein